MINTIENEVGAGGFGLYKHQEEETMAKDCLGWRGWCWTNILVNGICRIIETRVNFSWFDD